jgi:hypothetical protein
VGDDEERGLWRLQFKHDLPDVVFGERREEMDAADDGVKFALPRASCAWG